MLFFLNIRILTYLTLVCLFFPIHIPFMGKDAITTGTVLIFILYIKYLSKSFFMKDCIKENYDYWIYIVIIFGAISFLISFVSGALEISLIGRSIRYYLLFLSSMLIFIIIKNYRPYQEDSSNSNLLYCHLENLLSIILFLSFIHILISLLIKVFPSLSTAFSIFFPRSLEAIDFNRGGIDQVERIRTFIMTPESYGEILASLSPIVLYKYFKYRDTIWIIFLLVFFIGEIFAVTRSGIVLYISGVTIFFFYYTKWEFKKTIFSFFVFIFVIIMTAIIFPSIFEGTITRFLEASNVYNSGGTFIEVINRRGFIPSFELTISNLSFFGNGISPFHFHNLFLTSFYEKGIIGGFLFLGILFYPFTKLIISFIHEHDIKQKRLLFSCILSMTIFFINEFKYEFIRGSSYQQICMAIFATYYLSISHYYSKKLY